MNEQTQTRRRLRSLVAPVVATFLFAGVAAASAPTFDSLHVGTTEEGGVSFLNGTIVNANGPVTIGDDLRVDGRLSRLPGESDKPVIVADDFTVEGDVQANNLYTKTEVDALIAAIETGESVDLSSYYTKTESDAAYYSRATLDTSLAAKADDTDLANYVSKASPSWTARTGYSILTAPSFTPAQSIGPVLDLSSFNANVLGTILAGQSGETILYSAPVDVPHGATITGLSAYIGDLSATVDEDTVLTFTSTSVSEGTGTIGTISTEGLGSTGSSIELTAPTLDADYTTVDLSDRVYLANVTFSGASQTLFWARVAYSYTEPY